MHPIKTGFIIILSILCFIACDEDQSVQLIIHNANVYTVDTDQPNVQAVAITDGKIQEVGDNESILKLKGPETKVIDAQGNFVMPGFIEGHGHYSGMGYSRLNLNFMKSKNWDDIVAMVAEKVKTAKPGEWIEGRGWHQEKWDISPEQNVHGYPLHQSLSEVSPDNPVILTHASGHSLYANAKAMSEAGVTTETPNPDGGAIIRDDEGAAVGVFEERAMRMVRAAHRTYLDGLSQEALVDRWYEAIVLAEEECLSKGVTSFQDAGSTFEELERYTKYAEDGKFNIRLWAMARHSSKTLTGKVGKYKVIGAGNNFFTCRAIKSEVDGALGAHGAWLLKSYADKANFVGQNTTTIEEVQEIAKIAAQNDMQLCVHAIGDRANQEVLDIFESTMASSEKRWRIEHAQHLHPDDIPRFAELGVIASMQGIHCTSDAPFVVKRLGLVRARDGAYPWRSLLDSGALIANGTDAPVEDVDPIQSFYASVTRKRADSGMEFFTDQSMTRAEAIKSYTLDNAYAAFEEDIKGSLTPGKVGDITILSKDLINCADDEILDAKVLYTIVDGEVKYKS